MCLKDRQHREERRQHHSIARNPDTVFLLGLLVISGMGQLISGADSASVNALVPHWMLVVWSVTITVAALTVLAGALWPGRDTTGLMVEAMGRVMLAPTSLAYAVAVGQASPDSDRIVALLVGLAASSVWRLVQILRAMLRLRRDMIELERRQAQQS